MNKQKIKQLSRLVGRRSEKQFLQLNLLQRSTNLYTIEIGPIQSLATKSTVPGVHTNVL